MDLPPTLAERLYLLGWNLERHRFPRYLYRGMALRAAALTDLLAAGLIRDEGGKVVAVPGARPPADPLLAAVFAEVAGAARPRSWQRWVSHRSGRASRIVRDRLAAGRWVRVEPRRILGVVPADRVTVRDTRLVRRLAGAVRTALRPGVPVARVPRADAALVALAAAVRLRSVVGRREAREHKDRVAALTARTGPAPAALRKAVDTASSSAAG